MVGRGTSLVSNNEVLNFDGNLDDVKKLCLTAATMPPTSSSARLPQRTSSAVAVRPSSGTEVAVSDSSRIDEYPTCLTDHLAEITTLMAMNPLMVIRQSPSDEMSLNFHHEAASSSRSEEGVVILGSLLRIHCFPS